MSISDPALPIGAVERDTGIPKDTLRIWERRYGFPAPLRDDHGERLYPPDQVATLRLLKRLVDRGHRPHRVVGRDDAALLALLRDTPGDERAALPAASREVLDALLAQREARMRDGLRTLLYRHGLERFVVEHLAPLVRAVGDAWADGRLAIHQEHRFAEEVERLLALAIGQAPPAAEAHPPILLATLPGDRHHLGLRMVEAVLATRARRCVSLGVDLPVDELLAAREVHGATTVALSISASHATPASLRAVRELRRRLPRDVALWLGGRGAALLRPRPEGVELFDSLDGLIERLAHDAREPAGERAGPSDAR